MDLFLKAQFVFSDFCQKHSQALQHLKYIIMLFFVFENNAYFLTAYAIAFPELSCK